MKKAIVFLYDLSDAWLSSISKVIVYDSDKNNIEYSIGTEKYNYTIPREEIIKIKNIIDKYYSAFDSEGFEIEFPPVLDGTINTFLFGKEKSECAISAFNLWYYENDSGKAPNAEVLLSAFKEIAEILIKNGVDPEFLQLDRT